METQVVQEAAFCLLNASAQGLSVQHVINEAYRLTGLPIMLNDPAFQKIASAGLDQISEGAVARKDNENPVEFKRWTNQVRRSSEPVIDQNSGNPQRAMCYDVTANGVLVGMLVMIETRPFTDTDAEILKLLASALAPTLYYREKGTSAAARRQSNLVRHLALDGMTDSAFYAALLDSDIENGLLRQVYVIRGKDKADVTLPIVFEHLRTSVNVLAGLLDHELIVIASADNDVKKTIISQLDAFDLYAGASIAFDDLRETHLYYEQAKAALCYAEERRLTVYADCFLSDVARCFAKQSYASKCIRPEIRALYEYDKQNGTEFLSTWACYLENKCNTAEAAKALYCHYNTLKYRLRAVRDIIGMEEISLKDAIEMLLSIQLLKQNV